MIRGTMAVAAVTPRLPRRAEQSRQARFARLVALIFDTIFVGVLTWFATTVYGVEQITWSASGGGAFAFWGSQTQTPGIWAAMLWLVYYTACEGMFGATPGKALNGLRVVSIDERPLSFGRVIVRNLLRPVDVLPGMYLLGGFVVLLTANSQRIGDLAAGTTVVFRHDALEPGATRSSSRRARVAFAATVAVALVFTIAFEYFERPVLVIQGMLNTNQQLNPSGAYSFSLGQPARTLGSVSYPITVRTPTESCSGTIELQWIGLSGWQISGDSLACGTR
jgi:uncharacterized RDD family membrane protein YckC